MRDVATQEAKPQATLPWPRACKRIVHLCLYGVHDRTSERSADAGSPWCDVRSVGHGTAKVAVLQGHFLSGLPKALLIQRGGSPEKRLGLIELKRPRLEILFHCQEAAKNIADSVCEGCQHTTAAMSEAKRLAGTCPKSSLSRSWRRQLDGLAPRKTVLLRPNTEPTHVEQRQEDPDAPPPRKAVSAGCFQRLCRDL